MSTVCVYRTAAAARVVPHAWFVTSCHRRHDLRPRCVQARYLGCVRNSLRCSLVSRTWAGSCSLMPFSIVARIAPSSSSSSEVDGRLPQRPPHPPLASFQHHKEDCVAFVSPPQRHTQPPWLRATRWWGIIALTSSPSWVAASSSAVPYSSDVSTLGIEIVPGGRDHPPFPQVGVTPTRPEREMDRNRIMSGGASNAKVDPHDDTTNASLPQILRQGTLWVSNQCRQQINLGTSSSCNLWSSCHSLVDDARSNSMAIVRRMASPPSAPTDLPLFGASGWKRMYSSSSSSWSLSSSDGRGDCSHHQQKHENDDSYGQRVKAHDDSLDCENQWTPSAPTMQTRFGTSQSSGSSSSKRNREDESVTSITNFSFSNWIPPSVGDISAQAMDAVTYGARQVRSSVAVVFSAAGFVSSSTSSLLSNGRTMLDQWRPTVVAMKEFLKTTGIDAELEQAVNSRLPENLAILSRIQRDYWIEQGKGIMADRREFVSFRSWIAHPKHELPTTEEALRYMKYSCAAYGDSMIRAAEMHVQGKFDDRVGTDDTDRIAGHVGIPSTDVVRCDISYRGDSHHLRHFVAVDHVNRQVVLAIRGTFSLSEIVLDIGGFSREFCGGETHAEMANAAERIWAVAGGTILDCLRKNHGYGLTITGHSLGAGAATLLNIMCHSQNRQLVEGRNVRCFAYASPPVFTPLELIPEATKSCTNYLHENDIVSFLSVDSVRHLFASVAAVDRHSKTLSWTSRIKLGAGMMDHMPQMVEDVRMASTKRLKPIAGAPMLVVPCGATVWMKEKGRSGRYDFRLCDPQRMATLGIQISPNMFPNDHLPANYEHAFYNLDENDGSIV